MSHEHERELARAFDGQAARFERATVQADPAAEAFLSAGCDVLGVDLSAEMIRRAGERCARFGGRARFVQGSVEALGGDAFDACVSRFVVHHAPDPLAFVRAQVARLRPGGALVVCDHTSDPEPGPARWHEEVERARDRTHTRNLGPGELVDVCARAGLVRLGLAEEPFELDFDEWFDRGTPALAKDEARRLAERGRARGFEPVVRSDGGLTLRCFRDMVRGVKPG